MGGLVGGVWRLLSGDREWLAETGAAQGVGRSAHPALSWGQVFLLLDAQLGDRDHATLACLGTVLSPMTLFATPWTIAHHASLSIGFPRQKNTRVGCNFLLQGSLPNPGIKSASPA